MLDLYFEIEGEEQLVRRISDLDISMKDWTPEFQKVGGLLKKTFRDNFSSEGALIGERWAPLKPATLLQKQRLGYPPDILIRTQRMKNSFQDRPTNLFVEISNTAPWFIYHQSNKPRRKLPRRVMMRIDNRRKEEIVKIFQKAVQDRLQMRSFTK